MAPLPPWADLNPDLLIQIADRLDDIRWYTSTRGACRSWRRAFVPPFPALLTAAEGATMSTSRPSVASLVLGRSLKLAPIASGSRCVGCSNGWLALCVRVVGSSGSPEHSTAFFLVNPVSGVEIALPPLLHDCKWISKAVFAPNPAEDDFAAAAICDADRVIHVTAGARSWSLFHLANDRVTLTDLVYHDEGNKVYCLTMCGVVHVLHLPDRRRRSPAIVLDATKLSVVRPPRGIKVMQPYYRGLDLTVPATIAPYWIRHGEHVTAPPTNPYWTLTGAEAQGPPDQSAPARLVPLLPSAGISHFFNPAAVFAPPYDVVSTFTSAKHLVLCEGNMYQVWRNRSCTVNLRAPGVGQRRVLLGEVLVLRYYPKRRPCWDVVKDLGGYSFFVGRNNAVSMLAEGVPGLRGNCVYWIDGHGREKGMIFDMRTGRSTPCPPPAEVVAADGCPRRTSLWYFLNVDDVVTTDSSDGGRRHTLTVQQQQRKQ